MVICADTRDRYVFSDEKHVDIHDRFTCSVCVKKSEEGKKSEALSLNIGYLNYGWLSWDKKKS